MEEATQERVPLAWTIRTLEDVTAMSLPELIAAEARHQADILALTGKIESVIPQADWTRRARQALRVLKLHRTWITQELAAKRRAEARRAAEEAVEGKRQERAAARAKAAQEAQVAHQAKLDRIKASNDEAAQQVAVFKEVAREVLGAEMYEHLWELARVRIANKGA
jgi:hypothetical protein